MAECPFCSLLEKANKYFAHSEGEYKVSLIRERYYNEEKIGVTGLRDFTFNYCPVCGKKINQEKENANESKTD